MKLLYVASNPDTETRLNLEREINELQLRVLEASAEPVSTVFLPNLKFEELPKVLIREQPDILHLAAHADAENLMLSTEGGARVSVNAERLRSFLADRHPPRLVYLNACDSDAISQGLLGTVPMAIGSTAAISNRLARTAAVAFYERILDGSSVARAFEVCRNIMEGAVDGKASVRLYNRTGIDPAKEVLYPIPQLIAEFRDREPRATKSRRYMIRFGLAGCPSSTRQVVFFTDDESFIGDDKDDIEANLCLVVRGSPARGVIWAALSQAWEVSGDFRLYAVGVAADGSHYAVKAMICDAIETRYRISSGSGAVPPDSAVLIADLRNRGGSGLD